MLLEYWYDALSSPRGICLHCSNLDLAQAKLYAARKEADDPQLAALQLSISPTSPDEIWITHKAANAQTQSPDDKGDISLNDIDV